MPLVNCPLRTAFAPSICPQDAVLLWTMSSWSVSSNGDLLFFLSCFPFSPKPISLLWSLLSPSLNSQVSPFSLYCPIPGSRLLLTNSFKLGGKVYTTKASVHEYVFLWTATRSWEPVFSILYIAAPDQPPINFSFLKVISVWLIAYWNHGSTTMHSRVCELGLETLGIWVHRLYPPQLGLRAN